MVIGITEGIFTADFKKISGTTIQEPDFIKTNRSRVRLAGSINKGASQRQTADPVRADDFKFVGLVLIGRIGIITKLIKLVFNRSERVSDPPVPGAKFLLNQPFNAFGYAITGIEKLFVIETAIGTEAGRNKPRRILG